jgi:hypothetical protein
MTWARTAGVYNSDTYALRFLLLDKYINRCKYIIAGFVGLIALAQSDMFANWSKLILVILALFGIGLSYTTLLGLEDNVTDTKYQFSNEKTNSIITDQQILNTKVKPSTWPESSEKLYKSSFLIFLLNGVLAVIFLLFSFFLFSFFKDKKDDKHDLNYNITNFMTDTCWASTNDRNQKFTDTIVLGPFTEGWDTLNHTDLPKVINNLKATFANKRISSIYIFGGVDIRALKGKSRLKFGDNLTLALSRGNKIRDYILDSVYEKKYKPDILIFPTGANFLFDTFDSSGYAKNRSAFVYGKYENVTQ